MKTVVVGSLKEFVSNEQARGLIIGSAPSFLESFKGMFSSPTKALKENMGDQFYEIVSPFLEIASYMSYPIVSIVINFAALLYIAGFKEKSLNWMLKGSLTHICICLLPMILKTIIASIVSV